jgi:ribonuclease Z
LNVESAQPNLATGTPSIVVTTLGTGTPMLNPSRFSQSILIEAGGRRLLFDTGRGAALRLTQAGVSPASVEQVFFTHYHSDHTVGFADFWLMSWLPAGGGRKMPLKVVGPTGIQALVEGHRIAFADDIRIRMDDQELPRKGVEIEYTSFSENGVVFDEDGLVVTAFESDHGDRIKPNFGYKIEYAGRTVVISGDTKGDVRVAKMAAGADVLFHSVGAADEELAQQSQIALILQHHTTPQAAGEIFAAARPKLAAFVHMVLLGQPDHPPLTPAAILRMTQEKYDGPVVIAEDLMRFEVGDQVMVREFGKSE